MNFNKNKDEDSDELWDDTPASGGIWPDRSDTSDQSDGSDMSDESDMSDGSDESGWEDSERRDARSVRPLPDSSDPSGWDDSSEDEEPEEAVRPAPAPKKKRRFFGLGFGSSEERHKDYFNSEDEDEEEEEKPQPKPPRLDPEDPDYWMEEESEIPDIMPRPRKVWRWWLAAIVVMIGVLVWAWLWMFRPYVDEAVQYGYVEDIRREGTAMKTFEGVLIPYKEIHDTTRVYREDFRFSVSADSTAARLKGMMLGCVPVRVEYVKYHMALPWRGMEKTVVVRADTADPTKILPPEFR